jgi:hypothetical protein
MTPKGYVKSVDLTEGDEVISKSGIVQLIYKVKNKQMTDVFDPVEVEKTHNYFSNGILSHQCVYLDEFSFVQNDVEFFTSTYPVISSGTQTKIIITSTPNGMNLFYKIYSDAVNKRNEFVPIKYTWESHPKRDLAWKNETIRNTSLKQFSQEHECNFLGSSNTLISGEALEKLVYTDPIQFDEHNFMYKKPIKDHVYVCLVDVSEGVGKDYSTFIIMDITEKPYEQVYVYRRNDISPWLFSKTIIDVALKYNIAHIQVENNSIGKIVADSLFYEYDYENLISSKVHNGQEVFTGFNMKSVGVSMNKKTKMIGCSSLKPLIEENMIKIVDWNTIQELSWFVKSKSSYEAEKGKTDDLVMPLVHFGWLTTQTFFEDLSKPGMGDFIRMIREKEEEDSSLLFGFFSDGLEDDF